MNPGKRRKFIKRGIMDVNGNMIQTVAVTVPVVEDKVQEIVSVQVVEAIAEEPAEEVKPKTKKIKKVVDTEE